MNRRTVLRGAGGIALGLPFLDAMATGFSSQTPVRLGYIYIPNGVGPHETWNPDKVGKNFKLKPTMTSLAPVQKLVNIHTGLNQTGMGTHSTTTAGLLSCIRPKDRKKAFSQMTIDQVAASQIGYDSFLPSLELSIDPAQTRISTDEVNSTLGCFISWSADKTLIPREIDPNSAFRRLFERSSNISKRRDVTKSILDYIKDDANSLKKVLGNEDNRKIDQYFYSIRQIERRISKMNNSFKLPPGTKAPAKNIPDVRDKIKAMTDIMVLAFQTDRTRVASLMMANDTSQKRYNFLPGVKLPHHVSSHHKAKPKQHRLKQYNTITNFFVSCYASMIKRMSEIREGDGTLLDNSLILFTSNLKDGHGHFQKDMPAIVAGKGGGVVNTGYHYKHSDKHYASLLMGMAKTAGCNNLGSFFPTDDFII